MSDPSTTTQRRPLERDDIRGRAGAGAVLVLERARTQRPTVHRFPWPRRPRLRVAWTA